MDAFRKTLKHKGLALPLLESLGFHLERMDTQLRAVNGVLLVPGQPERSLEKERSRTPCFPSSGLPVTEDGFKMSHLTFCLK